MNRFLSICALLLASVIALPLIAKGKEEQKIRINMGGDPPSLDPRKARDLTSQIALKMLFEGLTRIGPDEKPELALAEKYTVSSDGLCYTFTLRKSEWSNKDPVVAEDFVRAWKDILDPNFAAPLASQLYVIANAKEAKEGKCSLDQVGIKALDCKTLEVKLEYPAPYFLYLTATPTYFPVPHRVVANNSHWSEKPAQIVSNGPFSVAKYKLGDMMSFKANNTYWDRKNVRIKEIEAVMVSESTALSMFENKELDWAGSPLSVLPIDSLPNLREKGILESKTYLETYFFRLNTSVDPLNHPLLRKALGLAINRKEITEHILQGGQLPATGLVPIPLGLQEEPYFLDGNVEEAKVLFAQALESLNLKPKDLEKLKLTYIGGERSHLIAQAVQQQWFAAFGFQIKLEAIERKTYFDRLGSKDYEIAACSWGADFHDPINFLDVFKYKCQTSNNTEWEDQDYITLLEASNTTIDANLRKALLQKSERILIDAMPIIPIYYYSLLYVKDSRLQDVFVSSMGDIDFKWTHIENTK